MEDFRMTKDSLASLAAVTMVAALAGPAPAAVYTFDSNTIPDLAAAGWTFYANTSDPNWMVTADPEDAGKDVLRQDDGDLTVAVDGQTVFDETHADFQTWSSGRVGVGNFNDAACYDDMTVIPEPATAFVLAIGGLSLVGGRRRRKRLANPQG
jgi:hypothetical protein